MIDRQTVEISKELYLERYKNGIKLIRPTYRALNETRSVANLLKSNCNVYFLNQDGKVQATNETHAEVFGFYSTKDILGKTIFDVVEPECAYKIRTNDLKIINQENYKIIEEDINPNNPDSDFTGLTIKLPWYNKLNKIIGILGYTIVTDKQPLAESLSKAIGLGLLSANESIPKRMHKNMLNVSLSKRQDEILRMVIRGKTIKEISEIVGLSKRTVDHYFETIKLKFRVQSKSELIDKAFDYFV